MVKKFERVIDKETEKQLKKEIQDNLDTIESSGKRLNAFLQGMFYMQKSINKLEGYTLEENHASTASNISCYAGAIREKLKELDGVNAKTSESQGGKNAK